MGHAWGGVLEGAATLPIGTPPVGGGPLVPGAGLAACGGGANPCPRHRPTPCWLVTRPGCVDRATAWVHAAAATSPASLQSGSLANTPDAVTTCACTGAAAAACAACALWQIWQGYDH